MMLGVCLGLLSVFSSGHARALRMKRQMGGFDMGTTGFGGNFGNNFGSFGDNSFGNQGGFGGFQAQFGGMSSFGMNGFGNEGFGSNFNFGSNSGFGNQGLGLSSNFNFGNTGNTFGSGSNMWGGGAGLFAGMGNQWGQSNFGAQNAFGNNGFGGSFNGFGNQWGQNFGSQSGFGNNDFSGAGFGGQWGQNFGSQAGFGNNNFNGNSQQLLQQASQYSAEDLKKMGNLMHRWADNPTVNMDRWNSQPQSFNVNEQRQPVGGGWQWQNNGGGSSFSNNFNSYIQPQQPYTFNEPTKRPDFGRQKVIVDGNCDWRLEPQNPPLIGGQAFGFGQIVNPWGQSQSGELIDPSLIQIIPTSEGTIVPPVQPPVDIPPPPPKVSVQHISVVDKD